MMTKVFIRNFQLAGISFVLQSSHEICVSSNFQPFERYTEDGYTIRFLKVEELPETPEYSVQKSMGVQMFLNKKGAIVRLFQEERLDSVPYAMQVCDWEAKIISVFYKETGIKNLAHTNGAFFHSAWEDVMIHEKRLILHACCVETVFGGILFSGESGIGKSTQGDLWCRYENAHVLNGDRPILSKDNESLKWMAYGSPYAGSSRCHINASTEISMVVMLKQGKKCQLRRLSGVEAFQKVYAQLIVNTWDTYGTERLCTMLEQLVSEVSIYEYCCTPDHTAVEILKSELIKERIQ